MRYILIIKFGYLEMSRRGEGTTMTWRGTFGHEFNLTCHGVAAMSHDVPTAGDLNPNFLGFAPYLKEWGG